MSKISTARLSIIIPRTVTRDSMGNYILVGSDVAYNKSGNICKGTIKRVIRNEWRVVREDTDGFKWWFLKFKVEVEGLDGKITTIKNPNSLLII